LEKLGLLGAIEELTRPLAEAAGVCLVIKGNGGADRLPLLHANHLLRISHEAVANAVRHSTARLVEVEFTFHEESLRLEIRDDGCGFNPEAVSDETAHFGLLGMEERASKMRGTFKVQSNPGSGTCIVVDAPLHAADPALAL
jgi:signal transduction histidine kinase